MKSLYIHIPFCDKKCFYCSFVIAVGQRHRVSQYLEALAKEASLYKGTKVDSVYIGGGTPTFLDEKALSNLFAMIRNNFEFDWAQECTIEANPEGLDVAKLKLLKNLGVNRVSLGVQSLNDQYLKYLGRNHDAKKASMAFETIRRAGFDNVSVDLMYGFPNQTLPELESDVRQLAEWQSEHLSLYTLTIEEHSRFFVKDIQTPSGAMAVKHYELVTKILAENSFLQYEISNFAKKDKESRHNLNYWQGGDYIGLGVGAHSHLNGKRFWNVSRFMDYLKKMEANQLPIEGSEELSPEKRLMETFLFGLRMNQGINVDGLEDRFQYTIDFERRQKIEDFIKENYLRREGNHLQVTPQGRLVLDELSARLI